MNGDTVKINGNTVKKNGDTAKMNGDTVKMNGNTVKKNCDTAKMNGDTVKMNGDTVKMNGDTVKMNGDTVKMNGESRELVSVSKEGDSSTRRCLILLSAAIMWYQFVEYLRQALDSGHLPALAYLGDVIWSPNFWFPNNLTWPQEFSKPFSSDVYYPRPLDALLSISLGLLILAARIVFNQYVALPVGRAFDLPDHKVAPERSAPLEALYRRHSKLTSHTQIAQACKKSGWSERRVLNWFRQRRNLDKPSALVKWCEASFKLAYYLPAFWVGLAVLYQKDWFHDDTQYYSKIQFWNEVYSMDMDIFCYYQIACGFYWSQIMIQFTKENVNRKDFWQLFIHHIFTILLISTSFAGGCYRYGTMVILYHDVGDWLLELNKLVDYMKVSAKVQVPTFCSFMLGWVVSRLVVFPHHVLYVFIYSHIQLVGSLTPAMYLWNTLLLSLLVLHAIWTYYIYQICKQFTCSGKRGDSRSDGSESENLDDDDMAIALDWTLVCKCNEKQKNLTPDSNNNVMTCICRR